MTTFSNLLQRSYLEVPEKTSIILQNAGTHGALREADTSITYRQLILGANRYALTLAREEMSAAS